MAAPATTEVPAPAPKTATTRTKAPAKVCGMPNCINEVASGSKLEITVLQTLLGPVPAGAIEGRISTCKPHRACVGFVGLSPDLTQGTVLTPSCGSAAKIYHGGRAYCVGCYSVFLQAIIAQCLPFITPEILLATQRSVVQQRVVPPSSSDPGATAIEAAKTAATVLLAAAAGAGATTVTAPAAAPAAAAAPKKRGPKPAASTGGAVAPVAPAPKKPSTPPPPAATLPPKATDETPGSPTAGSAFGEDGDDIDQATPPPTQAAEAKVVKLTPGIVESGTVLARARKTREVVRA